MSDHENITEGEDVGILCQRVRDLTAQELVSYDDDGTTPFRRWPLETDAGEPVVTGSGVQTKRKVSIL